MLEAVQNHTPHVIVLALSSEFRALNPLGGG